MDNQPWDNAKLKEWKEFWESEIGAEARNRMQLIKEQQITNAMGQGDPNIVAAYISRAAGIEMIIQDILAGIKAADSLEKEDKKK